MPKLFIARLQKIDLLIKKRATGNAKELGEKLGICERTAKEFISVMRSCGAPIYFSRISCSYCYERNGDFIIGFQ